MRGGNRAGAGRKPGSKSQRTLARLALAERAAAEGVTPLEVMLQAMRAHHAAGDLDAAVAVARDAAPYLHSRLSAVEAKVNGDQSVRAISSEPLSIEEWEMRYGSPAPRLGSG